MAVAEPPEDPREQDPEEEKSGSGPIATGAGVLVLLGIAVLALVVLYRIYPDELAAKSEPGFLDNIFASNIVVFATRLVLFSAALVLAFVAAYIIWSVVAWMKLRQFLTRAGPFEVSQEAITDLKEEAQFWLNSATAANTEVQALRQRVEDSDGLIEELYERLQEQETELERLRETEEGTS